MSSRKIIVQIRQKPNEFETDVLHLIKSLVFLDCKIVKQSPYALKTKLELDGVPFYFTIARLRSKENYRRSVLAPVGCHSAVSIISYDPVKYTIELDLDCIVNTHKNRETNRKIKQSEEQATKFKLELFTPYLLNQLKLVKNLCNISSGYKDGIKTNWQCKIKDLKGNVTINIALSSTTVFNDTDFDLIPMRVDLNMVFMPAISYEMTLDELVNKFDLILADVITLGQHMRDRTNKLRILETEMRSLITQIESQFFSAKQALINQNKFETDIEKISKDTIKTNNINVKIKK